MSSGLRRVRQGSECRIGGAFAAGRLTGDWDVKVEGDVLMRVMVMVKASAESEAGVMPSEELMEAMGAYNEELVKAGIMVDNDGLKPSSAGARVRFSGSKPTVIDGPFIETKELLAGYWIWRVQSLDEAIEWVKRCPNPTNEEFEIEIRPYFEAEDLGEVFTPEFREQLAAKRGA
jgi:hypothetical protein